MKNKYTSLLTAGLLAFTCHADAQETPEWIRSISSPVDSAYVFPVKTLNDGNNHIYVLSTYYKNLGSGNFTNKIYLNKYNETGGLLWSLVYDNGGTGKPRGFDLAVDV